MAVFNNDSDALTGEHLHFAHLCIEQHFDSPLAGWRTTTPRLEQHTQTFALPASKEASVVPIVPKSQQEKGAKAAP
jgi:hypothetical protein